MATLSSPQINKTNDRTPAAAAKAGSPGRFASLRNRLRGGGKKGGGASLSEQDAALDPTKQPGIAEQERALVPGEAGPGLVSAEGGGASVPAAAEEEKQAPPEVEEAGPAYLSQRDNESTYGSGDVQCSPTSFAMQLVNVYKGDVEAVKTRARAILAERGKSVDYTQLEDMLIEILQTTDWKAATAEKPSFFWSPKGWAAWAASKYGGIYYKDPNAQQYVASLFDGVGNTGADTYSNLYTYAAWAPVIAALGSGAAVTGQGAFTASGHVVSIVSADASGVIINDPYGLYVEKGYYLRNGEAPRVSLGSAGLEVMKRRAKLRSDVVPAYDGSKPLPNWGEQNYYSWADVTAVQLGKWLSVLKGA